MGKHLITNRCSLNNFPFLFNFRFLRNPSELKSIKNISLLRQQMEAQAAAQKAAEEAQAALQQAAQHAVQRHMHQQQHQRQHSAAAEEEEPTDLTMGEVSEKKETFPHSIFLSQESRHKLVLRKQLFFFKKPF